jgi:hypothetical protein
MSDENAIVKAPDTTITVPSVEINAEFSAQTPAEMLECQHGLILWCERKIAAQEGQAAELRGAYEHAVKRKWKSATLKRHADLADKRVSFYKKIKAALEAGYYIVPNFPVTIFAIRTEKKKPLPMAKIGMHYVPNLTQDAQVLPQGSGDYKNPVPVTVQSVERLHENRKVRDYWADSWDDIEFPTNMAKLHIMEATTKAMEAKIFDELGMLPADRKRHPDPILVGHVIDPSPVGYGPRKHVTFMIAWHLDTTTL